jgi:hypothetical protein
VSGERYRPDPERIAAGWELRFVTDPKRAEEAVALYGSLGFDAAADPVDTGRLEEDCADCQVVMLLKYRAVYTRRPRGRGEPTPQR